MGLTFRTRFGLTLGAAALAAALAVALWPSAPAPTAEPSPPLLTPADPKPNRATPRKKNRRKQPRRTR